MKYNQTESLKSLNFNMTKLFKTVLNKNARTVKLRYKRGMTGKMKYLPSFAKEWKNIVYSFNKNNLKNLPINDLNINKIIQSYFDLFFKNSRFLSNEDDFRYNSMRKTRTYLSKIHVSNAEIKHTNSKVKITLYVKNVGANNLVKNYKELYRKISFKLLNYSVSIYKNYLKNISLHLKDRYRLRNEYLLETNLINKKNYLNNKLNYLGLFLKLNNLLLKKIWSFLIKSQSKNYIDLLRKYNLLYSLNHFKFNKLRLLPKLSSILTKITGKKLEYNIINLKKIANNTDLFTKILALKIKKTTQNHIAPMLAVVNKAGIPHLNIVQERFETMFGLDVFKNKYRNLNIEKNTYKKDITTLLKEISMYSVGDEVKRNNLIYDSIEYKILRGIKIEVKGRLTKRYRADRSVFSSKKIGGLKNPYSSFRRISTILYRGNAQSNVNYSLSNSKRRVGAFAVKGWIAAQ